VITDKEAEMVLAYMCRRFKPQQIISLAKGNTAEGWLKVAEDYFKTKGATNES
jgi:hypothetical protein